MRWSIGFDRRNADSRRPCDASYRWRYLARWSRWSRRLSQVSRSIRIQSVLSMPRVFLAVGLTQKRRCDFQPALIDPRDPSDFIGNFGEILILAEDSDSVRTDEDGEAGNLLHLHVFEGVEVS